MSGYRNKKLKIVINETPILSKNDCYYYFYKIVNNVNNNYYLGMHKAKDLYDNYAGSSKILNKAYKRYGIENFTKYILKFFDTLDALRDYEKEQIAISIKDEKCYNILNSIFFMDCEQSRMCLSNKVKVYYDINNTPILLNINDPYIKEHNLKEAKEEKTGVFKDKDGNCIVALLSDPRIKTGELVGITKGKVVVKDASGNTFMTNQDDPRLLTGEIKHHIAGQHLAINLITGKKEWIDCSNDSSLYIDNNKGYGIYYDENNNIIRCKVEEAHERNLKHLNKGKKISDSNMKGKSFGVINGVVHCLDMNDKRFETGEAISIRQFITLNNGEEEIRVLRSQVEKYYKLGFKKGKLFNTHKSNGKFIY